MECETYTPGPWSVKGPGRRDGVDDFAVVAGGQIIAEAFGRSSIADFHPSRANAALIAAAPDVMAALKKTTKALEDELPAGGSEETRAARAAIAKARGVVT